ncbi:MAG: deoxyribodipyrimidine photo-lyase [Nitrososphaeraceae archaeon]
MYQKSVFIFRRDLRLKDNTGLINALYSSDSIYCFFISDSNIFKSSKLSYSSFSLPIDANLLLKRRQRRQHLLRFLKESLLDLQTQFYQFPLEKYQVNRSKDSGKITSKLILVVGDPASVTKKIIQTDKEIEAVFVNRDYTPYSIKRDQSIEEICKNHNIDFIDCPDILINEPDELLNSKNQPFKVFFQYYNKAIERPLRKESSFDITRYNNNILKFDDKKLIDFDNIEGIDNLDRFFSQIIGEQTLNKNTRFLPRLIGTRKRYQELISELKYKYNKNNRYNEKNLLDNTTSYLSPYLKFGICSIREVYSAIQKEFGYNHPSIRQLYWRDFFVYIGFHFPFVFNTPFQESRGLNRLIQDDLVTLNKNYIKCKID